MHFDWLIDWLIDWLHTVVVLECAKLVIVNSWSYRMRSTHARAKTVTNDARMTSEDIVIATACHSGATVSQTHITSSPLPCGDKVRCLHAPYICQCGMWKLGTFPSKIDRPSLSCTCRQTVAAPWFAEPEALGQGSQFSKSWSRRSVTSRARERRAICFDGKGIVLINYMISVLGPQFTRIGAAIRWGGGRSRLWTRAAPTPLTSHAVSCLLFAANTSAKLVVAPSTTCLRIVTTIWFRLSHCDTAKE